MKQRWIYLGLFCVILCLVEGLHWRLLVGFILMLYWWLRFRDRSVSYLLIAFLLLLLPRHVYRVALETSGQIIAVRASYCVLKTNTGKYLFSCTDDLGYDDMISFSGQVSDFIDTPLAYGFSRSKWAYSQGYSGELTVGSYQVIKKGTTWRRQLFNRAMMISDESTRSFILKTLFHYQDSDQFTDDIYSIFNSTGLFIAASIQGINNILGLFFYPVQVFFITWGILIFIGSLNGFTLIIQRLIIQKTLRFLNDRHDQLGLTMFILLLINPYYVYHLGFQFSMLFQFLNLFKQSGHKYDYLLTAVPLQLYHFMRLNLFTMIISAYFRLFFYTGFILAFISLIFNTAVFLPFYLKILEIFSREIILTGKPNVIWLLCWLWTVVDFGKKRKQAKVYSLIFLLLINQYQMIFNPFGEITFLNIGQGDCIYIRNSFSNSVIIIDTGSSYNYQRLTNYLNAQGIRQIAILAITHQDSDHSGNMDALQSDYDVKSVITGKQAEITKGQLVIHGLLTETYSNNENDNSQIWYLEWHGLRYLLLGDISSEMERELVRKYPKLQADIVKLAHHGSSTSSSDYLLRNIQPQLAVISSGYQNRYHHPSPEVIQRLQDYRINYFNTAEVGDIQIIFGYFFNLLHTSKDEFVIIRSVIT